MIPDFSNFSMIYSSIILCVILFPFFIKKDLNFLIKMNSYGVYFVIMLILYVLLVFIQSLFTTKFDFEYKANSSDSDVRHLLLFGKHPFKLCGVLTLGFFSHVFIIPIMKNNEKQENNARDLMLGYGLVALTFLVVGILGYIGFSGKGYDADFKDVS